MKTHILCLGDSNTHGYCADPKDNADGGIRFNEDERWTCRLQTALGSQYLVTEEGLSGRTTVFVDPIHESMDALSVAYALLKSHEVIDLLIIMLGTNDVKEEFIDRIILSIPKAAAAVLGHNVPCDIVVRTAGDSGVNCKGCTACRDISADKTDAKRILSPFCCLRICGGIERTIWLFVII